MQFKTMFGAAIRRSSNRGISPGFRALSSLRAALLVALVAGIAAPVSAQIITDNAGVQSPQTPLLREGFTFTQSANGEEWAWRQKLYYSTDPANEFQLALPYIGRSVDTSAGKIDIAGFGDVSLRWKHALVRDDDVMKSTRWSTLLDLTAPTGDTDGNDGDVAVQPDLRISRGDWTFGVGGAFAMIDDRKRFAAEAVYRHSTSHDDFQSGDSVELNLAYWYRISPARFDDVQEATEVRGVLELLSNYHWSSEQDGADTGDDGAIVWLAPGLQVFPRDWLLFEGGVQLPIAQSIDDAYGDRHFGAVFGVTFLF